MSVKDAPAEKRTVRKRPAIETNIVEYNRYGEPTGETYARCTGCDRECIDGPEQIIHTDDCPHARA